MLILDTNHLQELAYATPRGQRLRTRLIESGNQVVTTVVTLEEELRGILARCHRCLNSDDRTLAYRKLIERVQIFAHWVILAPDPDSDLIFSRLKREGIRVGTMDLRIASIVMAKGGLLLTRNTVDFCKIPGLKFANWVD